MPVSNLILLSGAIPGLRDLSWDPSPDAKLGYAVFRSESRYGPWTRLTLAPVPGERYRDATSLADATRTVQPEDWTDKGTYEYWAFKIPNAPIYGEVVDGRCIVASIPEHVSLVVDGKPIAAARVDGASGQVWLPRTLMVQGHVPAALPYVTLTDASVVEVTYHTLANFVDPTPERRCHYTVVPLAADGSLVHDPGLAGDIVNILEIDKMDFMQAEMVRRNAWEFEFSGEPAHLLVCRTKGTPCGCIAGTGQPRTGCIACYETGIVGGYYGPYEFFFIDPDQGTTTETMEGGKKVSRQSRSLLGPHPWIMAGDLIIRKNGERLVIANPTYKSPRGVLLQQEFDVVLLQQTDTRYRVPLRSMDLPVIYNPAFQTAPGTGNDFTDPGFVDTGILGGTDAFEPVSSPTTDPTKTWENPLVPKGRTVVFGNIQT